MAAFRQASKALFTTLDRLQEPPSGPRILIYHQVGAGLDRQMAVTTSDFEWQLDWLAKHREVVDIETAVRRWEENGSDRLVVLTFDDGYRDTFTRAFPLMQERGFPFTLYVTTEMIHSEGTGKGLLWGHLETMLSSGLMTLGGHTHSHRDLRGATRDEVRWELDRCDDLLQRRLGRRPLHFTYPWGYWSQIAHDEVIARYDTATIGAPVERTPFDPHILPRFPVQLSDRRRWFVARLRGGLLLEERVRRTLRGYRGP